MSPKLLGVLLLLQVYAVIAVPLLSSEDEEEIIPLNQSPMKEPATSSFLRLFSDTIAAVPVAVLFAENSENALVGPSFREPRKGRPIDDQPNGFVIFETADGPYEEIGSFIEFSTEVEENPDDWPVLSLLSSANDPYKSWFMSSKSSDPIIMSEMVFETSQEESSDEIGSFPREIWVYDDGEQVADDEGIVAMDYILHGGTWRNPRMVNEEDEIFIVETNDEKVPLVLEEKVVVGESGDQFLVPVMTPSEENLVVLHWSDDQINLPDNRPLKEEPQEVFFSVPGRQNYPYIMPLFPTFLSPWNKYTKKSDERISNLPPIFII